MVICNGPTISYLARLQFSNITFSSKFLVLGVKLEGVRLDAYLLPNYNRADNDALVPASRDAGHQPL